MTNHVATLLLLTVIYLPAVDSNVAPLSVPEKPAWATNVGKDSYGFYADLMAAEITQRMRWIQPGRFQMGEGPNAHQVTLTHGYWLGDSEVTQGLWQAVMGTNPSMFYGDKLRPVETISWENSMAFFARLNEKTQGLNATFPSEAQWEYACRSGTMGDYAGEVNDMSWFSDNAGERTNPVKSKRANSFGLYDMHGNVWEWCSDWYGEYNVSEQIDPRGALSGSCRVVRGGSWYCCAKDCRSAIRYSIAPNDRFSVLGLRIAVQTTP